jgi:hypothetical protein
VVGEGESCEGEMMSGCGRLTCCLFVKEEGMAFKDRGEERKSDCEYALFSPSYSVSSTVFIFFIRVHL